MEKDTNVLYSVRKYYFIIVFETDDDINISKRLSMTIKKIKKKNDSRIDFHPYIIEKFITQYFGGIIINNFSVEWRKAKFKSLFLPRVADFIYIEGDNKRVCLLLEL